MSPDDPQVIEILEQVALGDLDAYQILAHPVGRAQVLASIELEHRYQSVSEGSRWHPDDDFEEILNEVCDQLMRDLL